MAKKNVDENGLGVINMDQYNKDFVSLDYVFARYHFDDRYKFFLCKKYGDELMQFDVWLNTIKSERIELNKII